MNLNASVNSIIKERKEEFYQSKYEYYEKMVFYLILTSSIASFFYWGTDCMLYGRIAWETLLPRASIFVFLAIYIVIVRKSNNYKLCIPAAYIMAHLVVFCTSWAVLHLENRTHANEGLMVIECIFIFLGFAAPKHYSILFHLWMLIDIIIADLFIHYDDFLTIIVLHFILIIGTEILIAYIEKVFQDRFVSNIRLNHVLLHDPLTGAYNRNIFKTICYPGTNMINIKNAGLLILDIDFFKKVNDTYGHDVGDVILQRLSKSVEGTIRSDDYLVRFGGEEFVVILSNVSKEILEDTAIRIKSAIQTELSDYSITVSIGGCMYDEVSDYSNSIKIADEQLYYVKQNGRNGIKVV